MLDASLEQSLQKSDGPTEPESSFNQQENSYLPSLEHYLSTSSNCPIPDLGMDLADVTADVTAEVSPNHGSAAATDDDLTHFPVDIDWSYLLD
jgi:hypothetical protein